jgi:hypothetical protein
MTIYRASPCSSYVLKPLCGKVANLFPSFFWHMTRAMYRLNAQREIFTQDTPILQEVATAAPISFLQAAWPSWQAHSI